MSSNGRRVLSQEELEIHSILDPNPVPQREVEDTLVSDQPKVLNAEALDNLIQEAISKGIRTGIRQAQIQPLGEVIELIPQVPNQPVPVDTGRAQSVDQDLPNMGMNNVREDMASHVIFGENVNEEPITDDYEEEDVDDDPYFPPGQNPPNNEVPTPLVPIHNQYPEDTNITPNEPDSDLPAVFPRPPSNWHPKKKIMVWLESAADKEWTPIERKELKEKFNPIEEYDPLLLPVNMPSKMHKALKSKATKRKDFLLNRELAEKNLFYASSDLCTAIRPLTEAISKLDDTPGCSDIKNLIGLGLRGIFSANIGISKTRRELGRKFVRLDCADSLFSVAPTHLSLFGNSSVPEAVKQAKEATKADDTLVFNPKKKFRPSYPSNRGFQYQNYQHQNFQPRDQRRFQFQNHYQSQPYNNQYNYQRNQFQFKPRGARGRGRGGRRGRNAPKSNNYNNY